MNPRPIPTATLVRNVVDEVKAEGRINKFDELLLDAVGGKSVQIRIPVRNYDDTCRYLGVLRDAIGGILHNASRMTEERARLLYIRTEISQLSRKIGAKRPVER